METTYASPATAAFPSADWYEAIETRVSRRKHDGSPVSTAEASALTEAAQAMESDKARAVVLADAPADAFTRVLGGRLGGYGRVTGVRSCLVLIGPETSVVEAGYLGEALVLEATRLHVDTCWVGGSFDRELVSGLVELGRGETVLAIIALGRASDRPSLEERSVWMLMGSRGRHAMEEIAPSIGSEWPEWARAAVRAAGLAPSGGNAQPWRFRLDDDGALVVFVAADAKYPSKEMDCGIAMLHAEVGALRAGVEGRWERLESPSIARFVPGGKRL